METNPVNTTFLTSARVKPKVKSVDLRLQKSFCSFSLELLKGSEVERQSISIHTVLNSSLDRRSRKIHTRHAPTSDISNTPPKQTLMERMKELEAIPNKVKTLKSV